MKKILVSDLDGTLIQKNDISQSDREKIEKFTKLGNIFVIATGRNYYDFMRADRYFNIPYEYLILNGGSLILNKEKNIILSEIIDSDQIVAEIITSLKKINARNTLIYVSHEKSAVNMAYPWEPVFIADKVNSICLDFRDDFDENIDKVYDLLNKNKTYSIIKNGKYIDILPLGHSKEKSITTLLEYLNIDVEALYTVGDDWNDISMLEMTNNSYAIISHKEEVMQAAKNRVRNITECLDHLCME